MNHDVWISKYRPSTNWDGQNHVIMFDMMPALSTFCLKVFFLHFHIEISMVIIFLKHNGAVTMSHSCHSKENIIFPNWIWIFSHRTEFWHFFDTCDFSRILKKIENSISYLPYFTFFWKKHWQCFRAKYILYLKKMILCLRARNILHLKKNWYCVCVRDIWGTQCHFMGRGSAESTDFFSGSFSQSISETIDCPILNTIKGREWYGWKKIKDACYPLHIW